jgi:hypothetical protein
MIRSSSISTRIIRSKEFRTRNNRTRVTTHSAESPGVQDVGDRNRQTVADNVEDGLPWILAMSGPGLVTVAQLDAKASRLIRVHKPGVANHLGGKSYSEPSVQAVVPFFG